MPSDPLAVRLRSGFSTETEQLQAAKLIDSLVNENARLVGALTWLEGEEPKLVEFAKDKYRIA